MTTPKYPALLRAFQVVFFPLMLALIVLDAAVFTWTIYAIWWIFTGHYEFCAITAYVGKTIYNHDFKSDYQD